MFFVPIVGILGRMGWGWNLFYIFPFQHSLWL